MKFPPAHPDYRFGNHTYSQHGEDLMILNIFNQLGIAKSNYISLGAHHPEHISNTCLMYERGWSGVNIEANPHLIHAFINQRTRDITVQIAVSPTGGPVTFLMFDNWSGRNTCSEFEAMKYSIESSRNVQNKIELSSKTLNQIVSEYCDGIFPEFLNCDLEGLDYEVLKSADFKESSPIVICVETRLNETEKMTKMMAEQGFYPYCRCGENILYVEKMAYEMLQAKLKSNT